MNPTVPPAATARGRRLVPILAFVLLMLAVYADPLFVRRNFVDRDLMAYNIPMEYNVHSAWSRGEFPAWTPEVSGGRPLMANPNAGALYPVRILLSRVPFPVALRIFPFLHWLAAGLGMLVLGLSLGRSAAAAWIGAITYAFSGVTISEVFFPHIQPGMALLPWIVYATQRPAASRFSRVLTLACLFALDMLAADVFTITLAILCAAGWIALEVVSEKQWREALDLAVALMLAGLAAAPQIVATALWIPQTQRAIGGIPLSDTLFFSIHPWRLLELVIPYPFGASWRMWMEDMWGYPVLHGRPMGLFLTLYAGAFATIAVFTAWRARVRGARFARVALSVALFVSILPALLPPSWQTGSSPLPLRNPEKFAVAIALSLALLAAVAFDDWRLSPRRRRWLIGIGAVLAALAAACSADALAAGRVAVAMIGGPAGFVPAAARTLPGAMAEAGLLWMATVLGLGALARKQARWGRPVAVGLLTAVPILATRKMAQSAPEDHVFLTPAFARYQQRHDPSGQFRALDESIFYPESRLSASQSQGAIGGYEFSRRTWYDQTPLLFGRGTVLNRDFDAGDLSRVESLRKVAGLAGTFRDSDAFFGSIALRFGIRYRDQNPIAGFHAIGGDALQVWDEHGHAFPDIRLVEGWIEVPNPKEVLRATGQLAPGEIVVESGASRRGQAPPGSVRVLRRSANRLEVAVDSPGGGWLFVLRAFWPYRAIRLDGKPVDAYPAQLAYCAVPIPPGPHRLTWQEEIPGLEVSRYGPILFGAFAVGGLAIVGFRRRKK